MERIASFSVDHIRLERGLYLSRKDRLGECVTSSIDIRMKKPNVEPVLSTGSIHTIEHLGATFLRNHAEWSDRIIYFGPMGCRTGCYLVLFGEYTSKDLLELMREMFQFMVNFVGEIPGATAIECGNYRDQDLAGAIKESKEYLALLERITPQELNYPD